MRLGQIDDIGIRLSTTIITRRVIEHFSQRYITSIGAGKRGLRMRILCRVPVVLYSGLNCWTAVDCLPCMQKTVILMSMIAAEAIAEISGNLRVSGKYIDLRVIRKKSSHQIQTVG